MCLYSVAWPGCLAEGCGAGKVSFPPLPFPADLLCWKGYGLYDCSSEFRLYWVSSKLEETDAGKPPGSVPHHARCFTAVPAYRCVGWGAFILIGTRFGVPFKPFPGKARRRWGPAAMSMS